MRTSRAFLLTLGLGLVLGPITLAGDDKDKKASGNQSQGHEMTVRGVVSGVTVVGETDIDFATHQARTAEMTYVTVIGHPSHHDAQHQAADKGKSNEQASSDRSKDKDSNVKQTSNASARESGQSGEHHGHRMNLYVMAISDKTKVCQCQDSGEKGSASASQDKECGLEKLEIGDRVEVTFTSKMADKGQNQGGSKQAEQKHGRHRTYLGMATAIRIMDEESGQGQQKGDSGEKRERSEKK